MFNTNTGENRWGTGVNGLISLMNGTAPAQYTAGGNSLTAAQNPTSGLGALLSNFGTGVATKAGQGA